MYNYIGLTVEYFKKMNKTEAFPILFCSFLRNSNVVH